MGSRRILVLFDVGATLITLDFDEFYKQAAMLSDDITTDEFKKSYLDSGLSKRSMKGEIDLEGWTSGLREIINPDKDVSDEIIRNLFLHTFHKGVIPEMMDLKKRLAGNGYDVGIFSNINQGSHEIILENYPEVFDTHGTTGPVLCSYVNGDVKPNPNSGYKKVEGYDKVVFIDDKESYLKTGFDQFGWKCILFTPYIDKSEAIRKVESNQPIPENENYKIADSVGDVCNHLRNFGVEI